MCQEEVRRFGGSLPICAGWGRARGYGCSQPPDSEWIPFVSKARGAKIIGRRGGVQIVTGEFDPTEIVEALAPDLLAREDFVSDLITRGWHRARRQRSPPT